jgi:hypothetical protein
MSSIGTAHFGWASGTTIMLSLAVSSLVAAAQGNWDQNRNVFTRLERGMMLRVRTNAGIDTARTDHRVYTAIVDQDVRGENGRLAIPRGSTAELIVRTDRVGDLVLDLESVSVNGERYAVQADPKQIDSGDSLVGAIVGAIKGGDVRGRAVRIPRDTVMAFRLDRPLNIGVADRGVTRDGNHYHDYDRRDRRE